MKLGVIADIHGNELALRAVLDDAARYRVDRWWVLGDLVLLGPRPAEVLELLRGLPGVSVLRGNTDRYVLTGEQPALQPGSPRSRGLDAPGVRYYLTGLQDRQVVTGHEGVRRTGHGLDGQCLAAPVGA